MSERRADRRRTNLRAFRPTLDGRLEPKLLMSGSTAALPRPGRIQTAFGGQAVRITVATGQSYYVALSSTIAPPQAASTSSTTTSTTATTDTTNTLGITAAPTGTIQAFPMPGGRFGLVLNGTTAYTQLTISTLYDPRQTHTAHAFNARLGKYGTLLNIGEILVTDGSINSILGYRTAVLSGPIVATSTTPVDRIAFDAFLPGATINVGGDLNTLDVVDDLTLSGPNTGVVVGRDLNSLSVGGNLTVEDGAVFFIGRDLGLTAQPAKGTGPAGQGGVITGNLVIANGSKFIITRFLDGNLTVQGTTVGVMNISSGGGAGTFTSAGGAT